MKQKRVKIVLLGVMAFLIITALGVALLPDKQTATKATPDTAVLSFDSNIEVSTADTFQTSIVLDTGDQPVIGADIVVQFDQTSLTLQNIDQPSHAILKTFVPIVPNGNWFDKTKVIETANTSGRIEFGVISYDLESDKTTGTFVGFLNPLAILTFRIKPNTDPNLSPVVFHYVDSISIVDSNVVIESSSGLPEDILVPPASIIRVSTKD